jgi:hypothetical protein
MKFSTVYCFMFSVLRMANPHGLALVLDSRGMLSDEAIKTLNKVDSLFSV